MTRRFLVIAALFGVLAIACGKYGPPVRVRSESAAAASSGSADKAAASAAEDSEEKEGQP